jgi:hypothetical protein
VEKSRDLALNQMDDAARLIDSLFSLVYIVGAVTNATMQRLCCGFSD